MSADISACNALEQFAAYAMARFGEALASRWPAEQRRKFALRLVASAARLGFCGIDRQPFLYPTYIFCGVLALALGPIRFP